MLIQLSDDAGNDIEAGGLDENFQHVFVGAVLPRYVCASLRNRGGTAPTHRHQSDQLRAFFDLLFRSEVDRLNDAVKKGQPLIIMEAMKMEHTITATLDGVVEAIYFAAKEQVKEGAELVALVAVGGSGSTAISQAGADVSR